MIHLCEIQVAKSAGRKQLLEAERREEASGMW